MKQYTLSYGTSCYRYVESLAGEVKREGVGMFMKRMKANKKCRLI